LVAIALTIIANFVFVAVCVTKNEFYFLLPVHTLDFFLTHLSGILGLPIIYSLLLVHCEPGRSFICQDVSASLSLKISASIAAVFLLFISILCRFLLCNTNPTSSSWFACTSARVSGWKFVHMYLMVLASVFFGTSRKESLYISVYMVTVSLYFAYDSFYHLYYFRRMTNCVSIGLDTVVAFSAIMAFVIVEVNYYPGTKTEVPGAIFAALVLPIFMLGGGLCFMYSSYFYMHTGPRSSSFMGKWIMIGRNFLFDPDFLPAIPLVYPSSKGHVVTHTGKTAGASRSTAANPARRGGTATVDDQGTSFWFPTEYHVELSTRFLQNSSSSKAVEAARSIYLAGATDYVHSTIVHFHYAQFQARYEKNPTGAMTSVHNIQRGIGPDMAKPSLDEQYFCMVLLATITHSSTAEKRVNHAELQRAINSASNLTQSAVEELSKFWRMLQRDEVDLESINTTMKSILSTQAQATFTFDRLLEKYPNVPSVLRAYSRFLSVVKNMPEAASDMLRRANHLEEEEMMQRAAELKQMEEEERLQRELMVTMSHITVTPHGKITDIGNGAASYYGVSPKEMTGMNFLELFPVVLPPNVRGYDSNAVVRSLWLSFQNNCSQVCFLKGKDGYVQPIFIQATEKSGKYKLVVKPMVETRGYLTVMILHKKIIGVNKEFIDETGVDVSTLIGRSLSKAMKPTRSNPPLVEGWQNVQVNVSGSNRPAVANSYSAWSLSFNDPYSDDATDAHEVTQWPFIITVEFTDTDTPVRRASVSTHRRFSVIEDIEEEHTNVDSNPTLETVEEKERVGDGEEGEDDGAESTEEKKEASPFNSIHQSPRRLRRAIASPAGSVGGSGRFSSDVSGRGSPASSGSKKFSLLKRLQLIETGEMRTNSIENTPLMISRMRSENGGRGRDSLRPIEPEDSVSMKNLRRNRSSERTSSVGSGFVTRLSGGSFDELNEMKQESEANDEDRTSLSNYDNESVVSEAVPSDIVLSGDPDLDKDSDASPTTRKVSFRSPMRKHKRSIVSGDSSPPFPQTNDKEETFSEVDEVELFGIPMRPTDRMENDIPKKRVKDRALKAQYDRARMSIQNVSKTATHGISQLRQAIYAFILLFFCVALASFLMLQSEFEEMKETATIIYQFDLVSAHCAMGVRDAHRLDLALRYSDPANNPSSYSGNQSDSDLLYPPHWFFPWPKHHQDMVAAKDNTILAMMDQSLEIRKHHKELSNDVVNRGFDFNNYFYTFPTLNEATGDVLEESATIYDIGLRLSWALDRLVALDFSSWAATDYTNQVAIKTRHRSLEGNSDFFFVMNNAASTVLEGYTDIKHKLQHNREMKSVLVTDRAMILSILSIVFVLCLLWFTLRNTVLFIMKEKMTTLASFLNIPRRSVRNLATFYETQATSSEDYVSFDNNVKHEGDQAAIDALSSKKSHMRFVKWTESSEFSKLHVKYVLACGIVLTLTLVMLIMASSHIQNGEVQAEAVKSASDDLNNVALLIAEVQILVAKSTRDASHLSKILKRVNTLRNDYEKGVFGFSQGDAYYRSAEINSFLYEEMCVGSVGDGVNICPTPELIAIGSEGFHMMMNRFLSAVRNILLGTAVSEGFREKNVDFIEKMGQSLIQGHEYLVRLQSEHLGTMLDSNMDSNFIIFILILSLLVLEYVLIFHPMISHLQGQSRHSQSMFLMIPFDVLAEMPEILSLLGIDTDEEVDRASMEAKRESITRASLDALKAPGATRRTSVFATHDGANDAIRRRSTIPASHPTPNQAFIAAAALAAQIGAPFSFFGIRGSMRSKPLLLCAIICSVVLAAWAVCLVVLAPAGFDFINYIKANSSLFFSSTIEACYSGGLGLSPGSLTTTFFEDVGFPFKSNLGSHATMLIPLLGSGLFILLTGMTVDRLMIQIFVPSCAFTVAFFKLYGIVLFDLVPLVTAVPLVCGMAAGAAVMCMLFLRERLAGVTVSDWKSVLETAFWGVITGIISSQGADMGTGVMCFCFCVLYKRTSHITAVCTSILALFIVMWVSVSLDIGTEPELVTDDLIRVCLLLVPLNTIASITFTYVLCSMLGGFAAKPISPTMTLPLTYGTASVLQAVSFWVLAPPSGLDEIMMNVILAICGFFISEVISIGGVLQTHLQTSFKESGAA